LSSVVFTLVIHQNNTKEMTSLPREIQLSILTYLAFFYDTHREFTEKQIIQRSQLLYHRMTREDSMHNIRTIVCLGMTCHEWYDLIHHQRMSRLWNSCQCMMTGKPLEKKYSRVSATEQAIVQCMNIYQQHWIEIMWNRFKHNMESNRVNECINALMSPNSYWIDKCAEIVIPYICNIKDSHVQMSLFSTIGEHRFHLLLQGDILSHLIKDSSTDYLLVSYFVQIVKKYGPPDCFNEIFDRTAQGIAEYNFAQCPSPNTFELLKPLFLEYRKHTPIPRTQGDRTIFLKHLQKVTNKEMTFQDMINRIQFLHDCGAPLQYQTLNGFSYRPDILFDICNLWERNTVPSSIILDLLDYLINKIGIEHFNTYSHNWNLLHKLISSIGSVIVLPLFIGLFKKFKTVFSQMTIMKTDDGKLPINLFADKFTSKRDFYMVRTTTHEKVTMLGLLIDNCPDIQIYKKSNVLQEILEIIACTADDKSKYARFIKMLS
jgi:hypothetical protein